MREELIRKYLTDLIKTRSFPGQEREIAHLIKDMVGREGVDDVYIDKYGNVIAKLEGGIEKTIVFEGHMDHVPEGDRENWKIDPYSGIEIDGRIYGRGAADMKGALTAMIASIQGIRVKDIPNIYYVFVTQEETVEGLLFKQAIERTLGIRPDLVILGEATGLNISLGQRGRCVINIDIHGETAHASMPEEGINALYISSIMISELINLDKRLPSHHNLGKSTLTPTTLNCTPKHLPIIPDKCRIEVDRRFIIGENIDSILRELNVIAGRIGGGRYSDRIDIEIPEIEISTWTGIKLKTILYFPAWITKKNRFIYRLPSEISKILKKHIEYKYWRFSTDGVYSAGIRKIDTIGIGPGDERIAHRPNEYINLKEVLYASKIYSVIPRIYTETIKK